MPIQIENEAARSLPCKVPIVDPAFKQLLIP
jgi:hypothetical protein